MEPENENEDEVVAVPPEEKPDAEEKPEGEEPEGDAEEKPTGLAAAELDPTIADLAKHQEQELPALTLEDIAKLPAEQKLVLARLLRERQAEAQQHATRADELARVRREAVEAQRTARLAQQALLDASPMKALADELRKAAAEKGAGADPWSEEALDARIQAGVAAALDRLAAETAKVREGLAAAEAKATAEQEFEKRAEALQAAMNALPYEADEVFLDEEGKQVTAKDYIVREFRAHPDRDKDPARVYKLVHTRAMRLKDYDRVEAADASAIERARASSRKPGRLRDTAVPPTPDVGGEELLKFYERYPAARARDAAL